MRSEGFIPVCFEEATAMRLPIEEIVIGEHDVREEMDDEHIDEIAESFEKDGQWNPIIVRPRDDGQYDLISGHYRTEAAKQLGWDEIEANVKNIEDDEADFLALKTNLVREGMEPVEEGKVLNEIMESYDYSQRELANEIGKSHTWVGDRLSLAMDLHPDVQKALQEEEVNMSVANVVGGVSNSKQPEFLQIVKSSDIGNPQEAYELRRRFLNDTLYTIGYEGRDWDEFVETLHENDVGVLVDVRASTKSQYKPDFEGTRMKKALQEEDIEYINPEELGVPWEVREPYINEYIDNEAFRGWYKWNMKTTDFSWEEFVGELEEKGTPALMCMEKHASPVGGEQEHYCHRSLTANYFQMVKENEDGDYVADGEGSLEGRQLFTNRVNL